MHGEHLTLRPFTTHDREAVLALLGDDASMAWSSRGTLTGAAAEARFRMLVALPVTTGFGKFAVIRRETGQLIGYCGIEPTVIEGAAEQEMGYRIIPSQRRQGFASEAIGLIVDDYFARARAAYLLAYIDPRNEASCRLIEKCGFGFLRMIEHHETEVRLYRLDRDAFI